MKGGWIKIHRSIIDHWIFQNPQKLKWWIIMLLEVNFTDRKVLIRNNLFECKRGESIRSLRSWANRFNTTPETVRHFFKLLQKDGMIETKNIGISTHLKICNYDTYQDTLDTKLTDTDTNITHQFGQEPDTNKKEKQERTTKKKRTIVKPTIDEARDFFYQNGYDPDKGEDLWHYYNDGDWHDSKGNPVLCWKQKFRVNGFKPENKKKERILA